MNGRNGVDMERVDALKTVMQGDPAAGRKTLSAITSWNGGAHSTTIARNFAVPADEPAALGGTDRGASPTELMLAALSACIAIGIAYSAAEDGIEVGSIEIDVVGDLDLRGFLNIGDLRPGLAEIRLTVRVDADAPRETIEELVNRGYRRSPVAASLEGRVPVRVCIGREETTLSEPRSGA
ncbi:MULTISPECIES: OsmC family protein [Methanoculleus]|uniref:OsmC family protein n=2 Tax=Methanoculleus TaxID=45989 RepID=A3CXZ8_METMJ|nr:MULTISPECIES: OsmC family protein [Methanoculleus]ABN58248.1 OsmC family protein [Methanoculleus marisnigri JR1]UYU19623.1 OsmC family protein [Methanoculleus submarinus]